MVGRMGAASSISTSLQVASPRFPTSSPRTEASSSCATPGACTKTPTPDRQPQADPAPRQAAPDGLNCSFASVGRASRGIALSTPSGDERRGVRGDAWSGLIESGGGSEASAERPLREQGFLGECGTMTQARRETPGGAWGSGERRPCRCPRRTAHRAGGPRRGPRRAPEGRRVLSRFSGVSQYA